MKIKYKEITNANESLSVLAKEKVSIKEAIGIARLLKAFMAELSIYQEKEVEIIERFGKINDDGKFYIKNELIPEFNREFNELLDYEVDLVIEPVKITSEIQIDAESVLAIEKFVIFE